MGDEISKTGKWLTSDGRVVDSEPVEGRLLVAPGTPITPHVKLMIDRAVAAAPPMDDPEPVGVNPETAPETSAETGRTGKPRQR